MHLPLAFSIHHFVSSVGADAGFAAIVGLAILVLLYFAQARETSSLRDQSIAASRRVAELEQRLAQLGSSEVKPVTRQADAEHAALQAIPAAPAGVAAPALAAATRMIPLPSAATVSPPAVTVPSSTATPPPVTAAASAGTAAPVAVPPPTPAPASAGAGSNGTGEHAVAHPPAPAPVPASQPRRVQIRPSAAYRPPSPLPRPAARRPARRRLIPAAIAVVLAVVAVGVLLIVTSSGGSTQSNAGTPTTNAPSPGAKAGFQPSSVTVAVLNGTDVFQLAHRVALRLRHAGYRDGTVATATDQTHTTTLVAYLAGHRHAAAKVASALKLPSTAVQPADQSAQAIACPPPATCRAEVIVTVGTDLSTTP